MSMALGSCHLEHRYYAYAHNMNSTILTKEISDSEPQQSNNGHREVSPHY